jgi:hypothetical protein
MFWPSAKKVLAPVGEAVALGEAAVLPGDEAGTLGAAAELAGATIVPAAEGAAEPVALRPCGVGPCAERPLLQAVDSKATQASDAQVATCRGLGVFVVFMMVRPFQYGSALGELYHTYDAGRPAVVGTRWRRAVTTIRSA